MIEDDIKAAQKGRRTAIARLYRRFRPTVQFAVGSWLRRIPRLAAEQEDIEQQTWERLLQRRGALLRAFDPSRSTRPTVEEAFEVYLHMIAYNTAWRAAARKALLPRLWAADVDAEGQLERQDSDELIESMLVRQDLFEKIMGFAHQELGAQNLAILRGTILEDRTAQSVADELGLKLATVQQRVHRLKAKLRPFAAQLRDELDRGSSRRTRRRPNDSSRAVPLDLVVVVLATVASSSLGHDHGDLIDSSAERLDGDYGWMR